MYVHHHNDCQATLLWEVLNKFEIRYLHTFYLLLTCLSITVEFDHILVHKPFIIQIKITNNAVFVYKAKYKSSNNNKIRGMKHQGCCSAKKLDKGSGTTREGIPGYQGTHYRGEHQPSVGEGSQTTVLCTPTYR